MTRRKASPEEARRVASHATAYLPCETCSAPPGMPCTRPGQGRSVHKARYTMAAIILSQRDKESRRTPQQAAILAGLPRLTEEQIEAGRSPKGGWTREQLARWGLPWPPPAGWRQALLHGTGGGADSSAEKTKISPTEKTKISSAKSTSERTAASG
jgi:hypothetical protein